MKKVILVLVCMSGLFANSPTTLKQLTLEHKLVFPTHAKQYQTIINKKELSKDLLVNSANYIYELNRYKILLFNGFLINAEKEFVKSK
ncbi:hypothetical protein G6W42_06780 [Campylobacter concisus]|jgi:hypothetical protein|uniref:hypothetical protein n=1 Tax=Campylobacter concisus TaxID=199 RepID=UPI0018835CEF|nr:hypothetical protein [Campylobacter concisus]MBE9852325.1 hypothetical protein [Campylobacter concisus]